MRGTDIQQDSLFSYSKVSDFVPADHPLRRIRSLVDEALESMHGHLSSSYAPGGVESIAPERLIRAQLLQALYSIRSERQLVEQIRYNMLYRWFVGLSIDDRVWHATTFTKNRDRFIAHDTTRHLLAAVVEQARKRRLLSGEHFSVDGTLIEAWASHASYRCRDDDDPPPPGPPDFKGQRRSRDTHESKTDPDALLYKKSDGQGAKLCYIGHVMTDNRHGLVVDAELTQATGTAEVDAALAMIDRRPGKRRITVGADKNYDQTRFVDGARRARATPHVARKTHSRIDGRTTRHVGYAKSRSARYQAEMPFGWAKAGRSFKRTMLRGVARVGSQALLTLAAFDLVRIASLEATA